ncbi:MAG: DUF1850 domain-containing protein [Thermodesulfobacteriota bacterium]|nr:DUF1850 domain-containing protein [Thermodesulfobacteriota bacterium]
MKTGSALCGAYFESMRKGLVLFSAVLALGLFLLLFSVGVLTLSPDGGQILFSRIVKPGDTFQLTFLHSVALSDVRELFVIDAQYRIVLVETRFQGQGTGLPYNVAEGEKLHREGDWFRISGMQRVIPFFFLRVQSQWHNRFRFKEDPEINLSALMENGLIHIQARKMSLFSWMGMHLRGKFF